MRTANPRSLIAALSATAVLGLAGCAAPSGPTTPASFDRSSLGADVDLSAYSSAYLAPVQPSAKLVGQVGYTPRTVKDRTRSLSQRDLDDKVGDLDAALRRSLRGSTNLVSQPGPGIVEIRVTLEDVVANRPTFGDLSAEPSLSSRSRYSGGASVSASFSVDGRSLGTVSDSEYEPLDRATSNAGIWTDADRYFRQVSNKIAGLFR